MNSPDLYQKLFALPPHLQREASAFIDSLWVKAKENTGAPAKAKKKPSLAKLIEMEGVIDDPLEDFGTFM